MVSSKRLIILFTSLLLLISIVSFSNTSYADIPSIIFINYTYSGTDTYYGVSIVGFREGGYGSLIVTIRNNAGEDIRLDNLTLVFEWGDRFTARGLPEVIPRWVSKVYVIDFTVPTTTRVSNIRPYTYRVEANYTGLVSNTAGQWVFTPYDYFAVLSKEQKEYYDLRYEFTRFTTQYPATWFTSVKSIELVRKAHIERDYADYHYSRGNFSGAVALYKLAIDTYKRAVTNEISYRYIYEEIGINRSLIDLEMYKLNIEYMRSQINLSNAIAEAELIRANADMKFAEAEMIRANADLIRAEAELKAAENIRYYAYAIIVFGIGFIIISIGLAIKFARK